MAKKGLLVLVLASVLAGGIFAQEENEKPAAVHKHQSFDMLLGLNYGMGITPNLGDWAKFIVDDEGSIPQGNYAFTFDFGLTYDFYLFSWLSFNTGFLLHPDIYALLSKDVDNEDFTDIAATPICLTIPLSVHINVPKVEWLYAGIGLNFNIPMFGMLDGVAEADTKGDAFVSLPIDIGFDYVRPGRGGGRFFFRFTPEFHKGATAVPIGFIWQIYNWKLFSKK
jgi:hypothetical protein